MGKGKIWPPAEPKLNLLTDCHQIWNTYYVADTFLQKLGPICPEFFLVF